MDITIKVDEALLASTMNRILTSAFTSNSYASQRAEDESGRAIREALGCAVRDVMLAMIAEPAFASDMRAMIRAAVFDAIRARVDGLTKGMPRGVAQGLFDAIASASKPVPDAR